MMGHDDSDSETSLLATVASVPGQLWRDLLGIYYANTPVWRWIKSGTLVFFGFFLWAASNLLYSNVPEWNWLTYPMAYGFVLILWGPLTHMVVVPLSIRLRRSATHTVTRTLGRQGSKLNLSVFLAIVIVLGTVPVGPMTLDFGSGIGDDGGDVSPEIECTADETEVTCLVEEHERIDHVVLLTADENVDRDDEPPYELTASVDDLEEVVGQKQFEIEARDENGETLYRQVRTLPGVR